MDRFVKRTRPSQSETANTTPALAAGWTNTNKRLETPPIKKRRIEQVKQNDVTEDDGSSTALTNDEDEDSFLSAPSRDSPLVRDGKTGSADVKDGDATDNAPAAHHHTALEDSLPEVKVDGNILEEYEKLKSSQVDDGKISAETRLQTRKWVRGQSSIYVDAFNLALDTVLQDEAHLFDEKENCVFENWRALSYEAQYLYGALSWCDHL